MNIISPDLENKNVVVNGPKVGDIIVSCSGYEACIAHFAKVIAVTKSSVKIVRLGDNRKYTGNAGMDWESTPDLTRPSGEVETKRFKAAGDSYKVKDTSYANFYPWGGEPISCYNYH
jgi:hypothetical protein